MNSCNRTKSNFNCPMGARHESQTNNFPTVLNTEGRPIKAIV